MTIISIITAMSSNRVIGINNKLPWHIPEELQHFKQITMGKPIIMGRKTFESIGRRVLPGRRTIVMTQGYDLVGDGFMVVNSVADALQAVSDDSEVMVVGGAGIYQEFLPLAQKLYLSIIPQEYTGDAFFPEIDMSKWQLISAQDNNKFTVQIFNRIKNLVLA